MDAKQSKKSHKAQGMKKTQSVERGAAYKQRFSEVELEAFNSYYGELYENKDAKASNDLQKLEEMPGFKKAL